MTIRDGLIEPLKDKLREARELQEQIEHEIAVHEEIERTRTIQHDGLMEIFKGLNFENPIEVLIWLCWFQEVDGVLYRATDTVVATLMKHGYGDETGHPVTQAVTSIVRFLISDGCIPQVVHSQKNNLCATLMEGRTFEGT